MAILTVTNSDGIEQEFPISSGRTGIGRGATNRVILSDSSLSTNHAEIVNEGGSYTIRDLGSTNGIKINGESVDSAVLQDGDLLMFGHVHASFSTTPRGTKSMPKETTVSHEVASNSAASPAFGKKSKEKDPSAQKLLPLGYVAIALALIAALISLTMSA